MGKGQLIVSKSKLPRVHQQMLLPKVLPSYRKGLMVRIPMQGKGLEPD